MKKTALLLIAIICISLTACGKQAAGDYNDIPVNIQEETIDVPGLSGEHRLFFIADSHISLCDDRDKELMEKAALRGMGFAADGIQSHDRFAAIIDKVTEADGDVVILGGDIIDSAMYASIDYVDNQLEKLDMPYMFLMGNHDFEYGDEYFSEKAYSEYLPRLSKMRTDTSYQVMELEDLIYFTADDNNNQISRETLDAYKKEAAKGKPVVLSVHVPIEPVTGDMSLVNACIEAWGGTADNKSKVTMGINGCVPNEVTQEFLDMVLAEDSPVVLVLAGHIHFYHKDMLNDRIVQIVTGAALNGDALEVILK